MSIDELAGLIIESGGVSVVSQNDGIGVERRRFSFANGYMLSVIIGRFSYGGAEGFFEIAPYNKNGAMDGRLLGFIDDDVRGWLTPDEVVIYARELAGIPMNVVWMPSK